MSLIIVQSVMYFNLFSHHCSVFLPHNNRFYLFLFLIAVADGDEISQEIEVGLVDRSFKPGGFFKF